MNTPDCICIFPEQNDPEWYNVKDWDHTPPEGHIDYVRKDWILKELSSSLENAKDVFDAVRRIGILIDKVNDL